ncbi:hypothetical protein NKH70_30960, partial [Mesorhizobium sp. M0991]|uniref:hypothetical protein n=1 Tax=Mesorhizobium sp. M0991 TaxID=2957043 RepID=UPI003337B27B
MDQDIVLRDLARSLLQVVIRSREAPFNNVEHTVSAELTAIDVTTVIIRKTATYWIGLTVNGLRLFSRHGTQNAINVLRHRDVTKNSMNFHIREGDFRLSG